MWEHNYFMLLFNSELLLNSYCILSTLYFLQKKSHVNNLCLILPSYWASFLTNTHKVIFSTVLSVHFFLMYHSLCQIRRAHSLHISQEYRTGCIEVDEISFSCSRWPCFSSLFCYVVTWPWLQCGADLACPTPLLFTVLMGVSVCHHFPPASNVSFNIPCITNL